MNERGYLEGSEMANTFNLLRATTSSGRSSSTTTCSARDPFPFDLLHWNCDSTRMPAKMHSFYLRNMYMNNKLREPGGLSLRGRADRVSKVAVPAYFVSAIEDHIAPWKTTYAGRAAHRRQDALRAVGLRTYRGDDQSAVRQQIRLLEQ